MKRKGDKKIRLSYSLFTTAIGWCGVVSEGEKTVRIEIGYPTKKQLTQKIVREFGSILRTPPTGDLIEEIRDYASGKKVGFKGALAWSSLTHFQQKVLREVKKIPYGRVETYGSLARKVGCPKGSRAVGGAVASNPFPLVIPCHRVVRGDRGLGGFSAAGGVALKKRLLELEGVEVKCISKKVVVDEAYFYICLPT